MAFCGSVDQHFAERFFRWIVFFLAFVGRAAQEVDVLLVFILGGKRLRFVESLFGFRPALQPAVHLGQGDVNLAVFGRALEQRFHLLQTGVGLTHVGKLSGIHHFQRAVVWQLLDRFLGSVGGLLPLLGFAVGVDHLLVAAFGVLIAEQGHFAEGFNGLGVVIVVAVDRAQTLEEDGAVVLFRLGVAVLSAFSVFLRRSCIT